ncbi:MAG: hypothetical protein ACNI3H_05530 [Halarcobacter ebronensis]
MGALIIALGMLVDNAIVVVDGILVRLNRGMQAKEALLKLYDGQLFLYLLQQLLQF